VLKRCSSDVVLLVLAITTLALVLTSTLALHELVLPSPAPSVHEVSVVSITR
jgi:hypothetical protein